jgi:hypothetical protein
MTWGQALGGATQALAGIAMGIAGAQQMGKGGTYNTLMGLAGIFGGIGSLAGGISGMTAPKARASGGPVDYGRTYLVGEKGPELFVPGQSGTIVASNKLQAAVAAGQSPFKENREALQANQHRQIADRYAKNSKLSIKYESQIINNVEYVTADQLRNSMNESAERGRALAFQTMQNSVTARRRLGI